MFTGNINRTLFTASLAGISFSLPLSEWLLSVFIIILIITWIICGGISKLHLLFREKKIIILFLASYLIYLVWMTGTSDLNTGLFQLRLKLPLLVFPLVIGLSDPLKNKELRTVIYSFIAGAVVSSLAGVVSGLGRQSPGIPDPRLISPFISHIRLALMALLAISCSLWYFFYERRGKWHDWLLPSAALWLIIYLYLLLSFTGLILFLVLLFFTSVVVLYKSGIRYISYLTLIFLSVVLITAAIFITSEIRNFHTAEKTYPVPPPETTASGNKYTHDFSRPDTENGHRVWIYICEEELRNEWNRVSLLPFDGCDKKGQTLRYTLIRYLTSAGLTKDSTGVSLLTGNDILNIENGITNRNFTLWHPWRSRIYELIWQIDYYRNGGNPSGHSVTQRLEFYKTGIRIFLKHPLLGTGPGDLPSEFRKQDESDRSPLDKDHRLFSHNQYICFLASFGITGFILLLVSFFLPFFVLGGHKRFLPAVFFILLVLSMLWEDTLETHTGVSFFAYFYSVFIFGFSDDDSKNKE